MRKLISLSVVFLFAFAIIAQDKKVLEAEITVFGNCGMCKNRIEKSVKIKEVKFAKWDKFSKTLKVAYVSPDITIDSLQQRIAAVGHDTKKFQAPDSVYVNLPDCCLYRNGNNTH